MAPRDKSTPAPPRPAATAPSLSTLAAHLGLSPASISRVLSGSPAAKSIPAPTQARIFAAAKHFNYRPNVLARSLRRGHSMCIGVLVPELSEGYAPLVLGGLEQGLTHAGYVFFLCSHHHRAEVIERSLAMLGQRAVDGIVAIDTELVHATLLPTVTVSCPNRLGGTTNIVLNHHRAAELALGHLHALGHRDIAIIKGQSFSSDTEPRWQAILQAAAGLGLNLDPALVTQLEGDSPSHEPGQRATRALLARRLHFTAIFAFNDISAIGSIRALREAGLDVPTRVSVVGFDDVQSAAFHNPRLTTVRQPLHSMGMMAADAIIRSIASPSHQRESQHLVVESELIVRESTAAPPDALARKPRQHLRPARSRSKSPVGT